MSLATRCSSCGTVFRVVQDQLKVSEGWVRCGRCNAVFNALEGLFDLGRDMPTEWDASTAVPTSAAIPAAEPMRTAGPVEVAPKAADPIFGLPQAAIDGLLADPIDAHLFRRRGAESERAPVELDARDRIEFSDARFDSDLFAENASVPDTTLVDPPTDAGQSLERASQQPDFLRRADRRARWRSAPVRVALISVSALAALGLAAQVTHHYRDVLAAQWPALRPTLAAWCRSAGCTLEAPRRIDDVSVESTTLTRAIGFDGFVLSVMLRSRAHLPVATPSIDLSLTDGNGRLVARRSLAPRDFAAGSVLQPGTETALQVMLNASDYRVAGYTVEIFYP
ncbi:MAG: zinc-ribbon domain-containing protein [Pseudomonadota bacterium]|nr:zinc-ribbon domain-containing protein [Pseudomonadota bacterium]